MDWTLILASAAFVAALAAFAYAWLGLRALTAEMLRVMNIVNEASMAIVDMAETAGKMREVDATLSDHLQWHVAQQMRNSISLLRDIEQTNEDA